MAKTTNRAAISILLVTVFLSGCSFFMMPASSVHESTNTPDCTDSYIVPASDLLQAAAAVALGILYASSDSGNFTESGYIYLGTGAVYAGAAIYGFITAGKCRTVREKHDAAFKEMQSLLASVTASGQHPSPSAPGADGEGSSGTRPWNPELAKSVLEGRVQDFRDCVKRQVEVDPSVKGKLTLSLTIGNDGKVHAIEITSPEFAGTTVAECAEKVIWALKFPLFDGEPQNVPFWFDVK